MTKLYNLLLSSNGWQQSWKPLAVLSQCPNPQQEFWKVHLSFSPQCIPETQQTCWCVFCSAWSSEESADSVYMLPSIPAGCLNITLLKSLLHSAASGQKPHREINMRRYLSPFNTVSYISINSHRNSNMIWQFYYWTITHTEYILSFSDFF